MCCGIRATPRLLLGAAVWHGGPPFRVLLLCISKGTRQTEQRQSPERAKRAPQRGKAMRAGAPQLTHSGGRLSPFRPVRGSPPPPPPPPPPVYGQVHFGPAPPPRYGSWLLASWGYRA